ncbi:MAG: arsenical pump-driving ATPase [Bdellovibrio sp.]|nr:MAG: arsenical pump-driving ATPase [Bdellovibrio sp.]
MALVHFVSGKGGVGKSAVAAGLALAYARRQKRTLLVELSSESFYQEAFGTKFSSVPSPWREGVEIAVWNGPSCLREYALHLLKSETLYRLFFENNVSKTLIQVAPGLSEIAILGKITSGPPRNVGPKMPYDVLVVDAFATGHFLALLKAPFGFSQAIRFGPMGEQTRSMIEVIQNSDLCRYLLVTLAEDLPVAETKELKGDLEKFIPVKAHVAVNRWLEPPPGTGGPPAFLEYLRRTEKRQAAALAAFTRGVCGGAGGTDLGGAAHAGENVSRLPWIFSPHFGEVAEGLAKEFDTHV